MNDEQLETIMYALTLKARGKGKRAAWLDRGFAKINRRPGSLLAYWRNKLEKSAEHRAMADDVLMGYETALAASKNRNTSTPGIAAMAGNMASAVVAEGKAIIAGKEPVDEPEKQRRLSICMKCPRLIEKGDDAPRCAECGCFLKRKIGWRSQACPLGKW